MNNFNSKEQHEIEIRTPKQEEMEDVWEAEWGAWSILAPVPGQKEALFSDYAIFPDGFLTAFVDGKAAGNCYTSRLNYDLDNPIRTWEEVADNGRGTNHTPDGETLYVLALGVSSKYQGMKLGQQLIAAQQEQCRKFNCKRLVLGCRVPDYHKHSQMSIDEYILLKDENGRYIDRELRFYSRCGLKFLKPLPEYMSGDNADPDSLNYGVLSVWENPDYVAVEK